MSMPPTNADISRVFVSLLCGLYHVLSYCVICLYLPLNTSSVITFKQIQIFVSSLISVSMSKVYRGIFFLNQRHKKFGYQTVILKTLVYQ